MLIIELPSLPKSFVLNINIIGMIVIFVLVVIVAMWNFLPMYLKPVIEIPPGTLNTEFSYIQEVDRGGVWDLNLTVNNDGLTSIHNVSIKVMPDNVVEETEEVVEAILPKTTREYYMYVKIRENAPQGNHTVRIIITGKEIPPQEKRLEILVR